MQMNEKIEIIDDWNFINSFDNNYNKLLKSKTEINNNLSKKILNMFQFIPRNEWINEGININTMKTFNIAYSTLNQSIIIPHFDINDNLIGIRQRSLLNFDIENYGKYTPFKICNVMYNHKLNNNLYGININKNIQKNLINPLLPYFKINILWDTNNLLDYKDSPTDKGKDVLLQLMKNKIYIN